MSEPNEVKITTGPQPQPGTWTLGGGRVVRVWRWTDGTRGLQVERDDVAADLADIPPEVAAEIAEALGPAPLTANFICREPGCHLTVSTPSRQGPGSVAEPLTTPFCPKHAPAETVGPLEQRVLEMLIPANCPTPDDVADAVALLARELDDRAGPILGAPTKAEREVQYLPAYGRDYARALTTSSTWRPLVESDVIREGDRFRDPWGTAYPYDIVYESPITQADMVAENWEILRS